MKKQFLSLIMLALAVLGSIGGFGWSLYNGSYVIAVGVVGLTYLAWPEIVRHFKVMFVNDD
jgi:hypothetical protein